MKKIHLFVFGLTSFTALIAAIVALLYCATPEMLCVHNGTVFVEGIEYGANQPLCVGVMIEGRAVPIEPQPIADCYMAYPAWQFSDSY